MSVRDKIRSADDRTVEPAEVPEWGVSLLLVSPDAIRRGQLQQAIADDRDRLGQDDFTRFMARMVVACAADPETGELIYDLANPDDVSELAGKNGAVIERLGQRCLVVSGMNAEAVDEGKADTSDTPSAATSTD